MAKGILFKRLPSWLSWSIKIPLVLLLIFFLFNVFLPSKAHLPSKAQPPDDLKTIVDFKEWQQKPNGRQGTFEHSGVTYTVMYGPAGTSLPSGPAAYLFDENGAFIDWTPDVGDIRTKKHNFDLTGDNVKFIGQNTPTTCPAIDLNSPI
jgi:hypothetical protein